MKAMLKIIFAVVVVVFLSGIYEQLRLSNMTEQQRLEHVAAKERDAAAEEIADSERLQNYERIVNLSWSDLQSAEDRSTWLFIKAMPWAYCLLVFGVFWVFWVQVQMVINPRNR